MNLSICLSIYLSTWCVYEDHHLPDVVKVVLDVVAEQYINESIYLSIYLCTWSVYEDCCLLDVVEVVLDVVAHPSAAPRRDQPKEYSNISNQFLNTVRFITPY